MINRRNFLFGAVTPMIAGPRASPPDPKWKADWFQINWEREKYEGKIETDLIVLHHTEGKPGITWQGLSRLHRANIYAPVYKTVENPDRPSLKGATPYSGHFRLHKGVLVEVFYTYHWLIRQDGRTERLLADTEVGWHCHNWEENMRSIAICFDGNYLKTPPSKAALEACAELIKDYAARMPIKRLKPHSDLNKRKKCPGAWFASRGSSGLTGEAKLLEMAGLTLDT